ncbi:hypothetical protein BaRGS_00035782 [Batillaria attramentaria]|uniref:PRELI/MSF1 domain-containing protein n=1 Tax=Batillaria attramentaria TaxID=370345 RepID=A0ABD0JDS0_9CAEN
MVVSIDVKHTFRFPIHLVVQTHFTKYPNDKEKSVQRVDVLEHKIDYKKGIDYRRRVAICENVLPQLLRKFSILNEENIQLEEEAWLDMKTGSLRLESHNVTWAQYAKMGEESHFTTSSENPNWTQFEQHGEININGLGPFGKVLEVFTKQFLNTGVKRSLRIMDDLLTERCGNKSTTLVS